jgi:hypothetical protein
VLLRKSLATFWSGSLLVLLGALQLQADPLQYNIVLHGGGGTTFPCSNTLPYPESVQSFGCNVQDTNIGSFDVDPSVLQLDGADLGSTVTHFHLTIGDYTWDQDLGLPNFAGFRWPLPGTGFSSTTFGFDVSNGVIVGLEGGVYSTADWPTVDFHGTTFEAADINWASGGAFGGNFELVQLPEPSTWLLLASGLVGILIMKRRVTQTKA